MGAVVVPDIDEGCIHVEGLRPLSLWENFLPGGRSCPRSSLTEAMRMMPLLDLILSPGQHPPRFTDVARAPPPLVTHSAPPWSLLLQALLEEINKAQEKLRSFDAEKQSCAVRLREAEAAARSAAEQLESHDDGGRLPDAAVWLMPFG